jgi:hypothetical protein
MRLGKPAACLPASGLYYLAFQLSALLCKPQKIFDTALNQLQSEATSSGSNHGTDRAIKAATAPKMQPLPTQPHSRPAAHLNPGMAQKVQAWLQPSATRR